MGYYRNGMFRVYKDSLGFPTIGYGHLLKPGESFPNGITEETADKILYNDIVSARNDSYKLGLALPNDWQDFMVLMVFQLGITKTRQFKKMIAALKKGDYKEAVVQAKSSAWYVQTPNRVDAMIADLTNK
ncbi:glycoside hydrolase family protein [Klebsiella aerogenes]|uniref:glycoside hydrolase family protein n=2 Tax=Klebsiella aerogenes TaxID=548 RepID=UPI00063C683E|nr:glycoside hydrolase family protein [Klebsiella aerogenes]KLE44080.1 lysozyme [Klebsiella aerogenes]